MRSADMIGSNIEHLSMEEGFRCWSSGAHQRGSRGPNVCRSRRGKEIATKAARLLEAPFGRVQGTFAQLHHGEVVLRQLALV